MLLMCDSMVPTILMCGVLYLVIFASRGNLVAVGRKIQPIDGFDVPFQREDALPGTHIPDTACNTQTHVG